jgi:hypothetical protein
VQSILFATASEFGIHTLWEWIEQNASIVYPAVALGIIALIIGGLFASWRGEDLDAAQKIELKSKIIQLVRRRVSGVSADMVAAELQLDLHVAAKLLQDLEEEGLVSSTTGRGPSVPVQYRIRGHQ